ncbi:MAG: metallophosphoesterase [bacterium]
MRIIAFGDIHEHTDHLSAIEDLPRADCVVITGDLTNTGGIERAKMVIDHVRRYNTAVFAQAGNFDRREVESFLQGLGISIHGNGIIQGTIGIFGVGGSNPTPFNTPNEFAEHEIHSLILQGYRTVKDAPCTLFVPHAPPYDTAVDMVRSGEHVGSTAVREFIELYQPDVCVTGHIHEGKGEDRIGRTHVVNPGPLAQGGYVELIEGKTGVEARLRQVRGK